MSAFSQSAGSACTDHAEPAGTPTSQNARLNANDRRELERVLVFVLEDIALALNGARALLGEASDAPSASEGAPFTAGAAALVAQAGALADRTITALGGFPINGNADRWHLGQVGQVTREALAMLEQRRAVGVQ